MLHHPHVHMIVPAVGLDSSGCALVYPRYEDYLLPHALFAKEVRDTFASILLINHRALYDQVDPDIWKMQWNVNCLPGGRGKTALHCIRACRVYPSLALACAAKTLRALALLRMA